MDIKKKLTVATISAGGVLAASPAFAQTTDPTGGAYGTALSDITAFVTGTAAGPLLALAAASTGIMVGARWIKKARGMAS